MPSCLWLSHIQQVPTCGIIVLLKVPPKYRELIKNKTEIRTSQKIMCMPTIFVEHRIMAHTP